ncbi:MAG: hypothetical protein IPL32_03820 [Chloracidobacterium sp.]|nr:hypothetical protein [Chloracidobacterium sp.]
MKSLTIVLDDEGRDICVLSRSIDGDLTGHGDDLKRLLRGHLITRESRSKDHHKVAFSMGHLAVTLIKDSKWGIGFFKLLPCGTRDYGEEYIYTVYPRHTASKTPSLLNLRIETLFPEYTGTDSPKNHTWTVIYDGLLDEFNPNEVQAQWECSEDELDQLVDTEIALAASATASSHLRIRTRGR